MQIPDTLAFELLGRKELTIEMQRRQIIELAERLRRAEAAAAAAPGVAEAAPENADGGV